jgi:hypothetical protein
VRAAGLRGARLLRRGPDGIGPDGPQGSGCDTALRRLGAEGSGSAGERRYAAAARADREGLARGRKAAGARLRRGRWAERRQRGSGHLRAAWHWREPDEHAFYYARVLENPTCRWSQKLCVDAGVRCEDPSTIGPGYEACCSEQHVPVVQERAWTSPIWYAP